MKTLRPHANVLAAIAALAVLLQAALGGACPHRLIGSDGANRFDAVLGWMTICAASNISEERPATPASPHDSGSPNCCTACAGIAPLFLTLLAVVTFAVSQRWPQLSGALQPDGTWQGLPHLQYGGRGSRAPPVFA